MEVAWDTFLERDNAVFSFAVFFLMETALALDIPAFKDFFDVDDFFSLVEVEPLERAFAEEGFFDLDLRAIFFGSFFDFFFEAIIIPQGFLNGIIVVKGAAICFKKDEKTFPTFRGRGTGTVLGNELERDTNIAQRKAGKVEIEEMIGGGHGFKS